MDELLTIERTRLDHVDVLAMIDEVQQEYVRRYGSPDDTPLATEEFELPTGVMLLASRGGTAVGMGGWRTHHEGPAAVGLRPGDAEIKRMYVRPDSRGRGVARALLDRLEQIAAEAGRQRMVLESGLRQPEAIGLYTAQGYRPLVPKFGVYRNEDLSVCMVKDLTADAG